MNKINKNQIFTALTALFVLISWHSVSAHENLLGNMEVSIEANIASIKVSMPQAREVTDQVLFDSYTKESLIVKNEGNPCEISNIDFQTGLPTVISMDALCEEEINDLEIVSTYFSDEGYVFAASISKGEDTQTFLFNDTDQKANFTFRSEGSSGSGGKVTGNPKAFGQFVWLGIKHIYTGYDHILFVLALILTIISVKNLVKVITAFTVAHSITLALSVFDLAYVSSVVVEPLIALSIVYVALEDIIRKRLGKEGRAGRWHVAFGFGLVHGLGFAGVLKDINLSPDILGMSLLSFNIGVEIAQLAILAFALPALYFIRKTNWNDKFVYSVSIIIGLMGAFWLFERVLF